MNLKLNKIIFSTLCIFYSMSSYSQLGEYTINGGGAKEDCRTYRLTYDMTSQSSAIWYNSPIDLTMNFDLKFSVLLGKKGDSKGADGIAFVLQPLSTSIGSSGGGMGYEGIDPSIGITIDTYQNSDLGDPKFHHITIQTNGSVDHLSGSDLTDPVKAIENNNNITDNKYHDLQIKWDATTKLLSAYIDGVLRVSGEVDIINDYFFGVPKCFWGFTGSTGAFSNLQKFREALEPRFHIIFPDCDYTKPVKFFDSTYTINPIVGYKWDFGDGAALSVDQNPIHTYLAPGNYKVKLVVVNSKGCTDSITSNVNVKSASPPVALYTYDKINLDINFKGDSSNGVYKWIWDFGDRSPLSLLKDPNHTYLQKGDYSVVLIVFNNCGSDTVEFKVSVDGNGGNGGNTGIINDWNPQKNISFYPNPFNKNIVLQFVHSNPKIFSIEIFNQLGNMIYKSGKIKLPSNSNSYNFAENIFSANGMYLVRVTTDTGTYSYKVLKH